MIDSNQCRFYNKPTNIKFKVVKKNVLSAFFRTIKEVLMARLCINGIEPSKLLQHEEFTGILYAQHILSGRWKFLIIWFLKEKPYRFGEIKKILSDVSQSSLTKQLRELESDGLIKRKIFPEVPPKVEYSLTEKGKKLIPILINLEQLGRVFNEDYKEQ